MKKQLILPLAMGVIIAATVNTAFSMPETAENHTNHKAPFNGKNFEGKKHKKMSQEEIEKKRAEFEKKRAEFNEKLGLTEEQKTKAKELRLQAHKDMEPVMAAMKTKYEEMQEVQKSFTLGKDKKIKELQTDMEELRKKADELRKKNMEAFENLLTPEQKATLAEMKKEAKKKFEERKKNYKNLKQKHGGVTPKK